ncbi:MAG: hypothetical protein ABEL76_03470 [Bradymonadaceae bacterium]
MKESQESIQTVRDARLFFRNELTAAFDEVEVDPSEETEAYLVHLLEGFTRLDSTDASTMGFDEPAAYMLGEAKQAPGGERISSYRRLGDASLFNCGFFEGYLDRRLVDPSYYQDMGRLAYHKLSELLSFKQSDPNSAFQSIFGELAVDFDRVVAAFQHLGRRIDPDRVSVPESLQEDEGESSGRESLERVARKLGPGNSDD